MIAHFLATAVTTAKLDKFPPQQMEALERRLLGVSMLHRNRFPQNRNHEHILTALYVLSGTLQDEFDIALDRSPGIMYLDPHNEARTRTTRPGQTKEAFLAAEEKRGIKILYVSSAPWPEPLTRDVRGLLGDDRGDKSSTESVLDKKGQKEEKPTLTVVPRSVEFLEHWGGVGVLGDEDIVVVVNSFNERLGISVEHAIDVLQAQIDAPRGSNDHVVLPDILPQTDAVHRLTDVGIVAVVRNGDEVTFLIDPQKANITFAGSMRLLAIRAKLDKDNELTFENNDVDNDISYTPAHLLMSTAAVLARTTTPPKERTRKMKDPYSQQEIRMIRNKIDVWNSKATQQGLPQLVFDERTKGQVLLPIDTKLAFPLLATN